MIRLNDHFEVISTFGRRISFACFECFDVTSLHLMTAYRYGAERNQNTISAGSRTSRARRTIPIHANEIIFQQGTRLNALKKEQRCKYRTHGLAPLSMTHRGSR